MRQEGTGGGGCQCGGDCGKIGVSIDATAVGNALVNLRDRCDRQHSVPLPGIVLHAGLSVLAENRLGAFRVQFFP
jgi:hypothetical protein